MKIYYFFIRLFEILNYFCIEIKIINEMAEFKGIDSGEVADACNKAYLECKHNAYFGNGFQKGVDFALERVKAKEMLEMLNRIVELENIICMGGAIGEDWQLESDALSTMMNEIKVLIKEATII